MPIKARAATPPTTTPAMRPVDGPELEFEDGDDAAAAELDEVDPCDAVLEASFLVDDAPVDVCAVLLAVLLASSVALVAVISAAMLVGFAGVGKALKKHRQQYWIRDRRSVSVDADGFVVLSPRQCYRLRDNSRSCNFQRLADLDGIPD